MHPLKAQTCQNAIRNRQQIVLKDKCLSAFVWHHLKSCVKDEIKHPNSDNVIILLQFFNNSHVHFLSEWCGKAIYQSDLFVHWYLRKIIIKMMFLLICAYGLESVTTLFLLLKNDVCLKMHKKCAKGKHHMLTHLSGDYWSENKTIYSTFADLFRLLFLQKGEFTVLLSAEKLHHVWKIFFGHFS